MVGFGLKQCYVFTIEYQKHSLFNIHSLQFFNHNNTIYNLLEINDFIKDKLLRLDINDPESIMAMIVKQ